MTQPRSDEVTNSFTTRSHGSPEEVPPIPEETWDTLGEPSGKFDYMVKYSAPESSKISLEDIVPTGWNIDYEYLSQPKEMYNLAIHHQHLVKSSLRIISPSHLPRLRI